MAGIKFQKRDYDFFVSYGHDTAWRVAPLVSMLRDPCGVRVWFDANSGNASTRSSELLGDAIGNTRGALFFLSDAFKNSSWCKDEFDVSLSERRLRNDYTIIALRLDDVEPPSWFNIAEIIDLREIAAVSVAKLLCSLAGRVPRRFDNRYDVYLASPWSRPTPLARLAFDSLNQTGWRLVGDSPDLKYLGARRIEAIVRTTRGMVAVLPYDPSFPDGNTSPYILEEAKLAIGCDKPLLVLKEPGVVVQPEVLSKAFRGCVTELKDSKEFREGELKNILDAFDDHIQQLDYDEAGAFIFYAGSLLERTEDLETVIERSSNMRCVRGERLSGDNVPTEIIGLIRRAAVVIADVSDDNRNTLIEAGIAMGSGTRLKLMSRKPAQGTPLKKHFMFEGQELFLYDTPEERLCLCYYFAHGFRRRVYVF